MQEEAISAVINKHNGITTRDILYVCRYYGMMERFRRLNSSRLFLCMSIFSDSLLLCRIRMHDMMALQEGRVLQNIIDFYYERF